MSRPPYGPHANPFTRYYQVEHLPPADRERAAANVRAGLEQEQCPPTYAGRAVRLTCGCPPEDARYDPAECEHPPDAAHDETCTVWCAVCSPPGPESVPADRRRTPRNDRMAFARRVYDNSDAGPAELRRALRMAMDEAATLRDERDTARRGGG